MLMLVVLCLIWYYLLYSAVFACWFLVQLPNFCRYSGDNVSFPGKVLKRNMFNLLGRKKAETFEEIVGEDLVHLEALHTSKIINALDINVFLFVIKSKRRLSFERRASFEAAIG